MPQTDDLQQQLLYEYWLKRDTWSLCREAVPLLLGYDPDSTDPESSGVAVLRDKVQAAAEEGELSIYNRQGPLETWAVAPAVIYRWATRRGMILPAPFTALMEFIMKTVKWDEAGTTEADDAGLSFSAENEIILGAALAVQNAFPDKCRNADGGIDIRSTIIQMDREAQALFGREELGFTYERVYDLLKNWLDKIR